MGDERTEQAKRLRQARKARGFDKASDATKFFGWNYSTYSQHERGLRNLTIASAEKYGRGHRVSPAWLLTGEGKGPRRDFVPIVGVAGAGPEGSIAYGDGDGNLGEAPIPPHASEKTVAVEVRGGSMRGIAEDGWLVYYDDRRDPPTDDLLNHLCVVGLADGRVLVKKLIRGRKKHHFDLESASAQTLHDVRVAWAAQVIAIVPREVARTRPA